MYIYKVGIQSSAIVQGVLISEVSFKKGSTIVDITLQYKLSVVNVV